MRLRRVASAAAHRRKAHGMRYDGRMAHTPGDRDILLVDDACRANGTGGSLAAARSRANDAGVTQAASRALLA